MGSLVAKVDLEVQVRCVQVRCVLGEERDEARDPSWPVDQAISARMSDLECIEYAVQVVLARCRREGRSEAWIMEQFAQALREARKISQCA